MATTLSPRTGSIMIALISASSGLVALAYPGWRVEAQAQNYLFGRNEAVCTGRVTSIQEAEEFDSTTLESVEFDRDRQTAVISSTPDGRGPIVIDNFLVINGSCPGGVNNACVNRTGQLFPESCFGPVLDADALVKVGPDATGRCPPPPATDIPIGQILSPIPPINVSDQLGSGSNSFALCDFGFISGNTDLFLVIQDRDICDLNQCLEAAGRDYTRALNECEQQAVACESIGEFNCGEELDRCVRHANEDFEFETRRCNEFCE